VERVAFLIEETNERISCLLNPNNLVMRRTAGVHPKRSATGNLTGAGLSDDPLLFTGGGTTELELKLLFDVSLAGSSISTDDVRDLTRPLWNLAENGNRRQAYWRPPMVRFIWGKAWNLMGYVVAVAERLEQFNSSGSPRRSWLTLRFLRGSELSTNHNAENTAISGSFPLEEMRWEGMRSEEIRGNPGTRAEGSYQTHALIGGAGDGDGGGPGERLDGLSFRYLGSPARWRYIAAFNNVDNPFGMSPGLLLRIPGAGMSRR